VPFSLRRSHRKEAKQLRWTAGGFLPYALPRECGACFAQSERASPLVLRPVLRYRRMSKHEYLIEATLR
jgi:hypothetical protein